MCVYVCERESICMCVYVCVRESICARVYVCGLLATGVIVSACAGLRVWGYFWECVCGTICCHYFLPTNSPTHTFSHSQSRLLAPTPQKHTHTHTYTFVSLSALPLPVSLSPSLSLSLSLSHAHEPLRIMQAHDYRIIGNNSTILVPLPFARELVEKVGCC